MRDTLRCIAGLVLLMLAPLSAFATDLTKIERKIAKEPAYKTKPKYCLLVFGMEAKHRVWLVQDGDTLYIDRNGNGDLTEPGNKIAAEKNDRPDFDQITFKIKELRVGGRVHKDVKVWLPKLDPLGDIDKRIKDIVAKNPRARAYFVGMEVETPGRKGSGLGGRVQQTTFISDVNGVFQFADRPQDAPIVRFDGPLEVSLFGQHEFRIGRESELVLGVGSPGFGPGTHTYIEYEGLIPESAHPTLEVVYPPNKPGDPPVRQKYELKERC